MTDQSGRYTVLIQLALTPQHRRRLEYALHAVRSDAADYVSAIVAGHEPLAAGEEAPQRTDRVAVRVYLTDAQRHAFEAFAHERETDVAAIISELVAQHLVDAADPPSEPAPDRSVDLRAYRRELGRLRNRRADLGDRAPRWLTTYIADLEEEIQRLEAAARRHA
jgi:hypothetical protein